jgi:hypothetical protein
MMRRWRIGEPRVSQGCHIAKAYHARQILVESSTKLDTVLDMLYSTHT